MNSGVERGGIHFISGIIKIGIYQAGSLVKNPPASAGNTGDAGSISGLGRSPEKEMATHSSIFARRILRTVKPGRLQSMGSQRVEHD